MYLPRALLSHLYTNLTRTHSSTSQPIIILVSLDPDALCAVRILVALLKRDFIPHTIIPVNGYADLARAGTTSIEPLKLQNGGTGGVVICLGVGGMIDLADVLRLRGEEEDNMGATGVDVWVIDARRPWNLENVFSGIGGEDDTDDAAAMLPSKSTSGVIQGQISERFRPGQGGIIVFDDGEIETGYTVQKESYFALHGMPDIDDDGRESDYSEPESDREDARTGSKRKSWGDDDEGAETDLDDDEERRDGQPPRRRRRHSASSDSRRDTVHSHDGEANNSDTLFDTIEPPSSQPQYVSARRNRRRLLRLKRKHESVLDKHYSSGSTYADSASSILYSLASDLGREDNDSLWHAIVGTTSLDVYGKTAAGIGLATFSDQSDLKTRKLIIDRAEGIRQVLRDEVTRLNTPMITSSTDTRDRYADLASSSGVIPTTARSPTDHSIRLSPEPRFMMIRHWSLYDSMLHSPYLAAKLKIWSPNGRKRLHKLLAKMGFSLDQCQQNYTHMDMDLKRALRQRLLKYGPMYGLDDIVPHDATRGRDKTGWGFVRCWGWKACLSAVDVATIVGAILEVGKGKMHISVKQKGDGSETRELVDENGRLEGEEYVERFWEAYDALGNVTTLTSSLPPTLFLHRAILSTGTDLLAKRQIRHLRAFRMGIVREGPHVQLFTHPGALTKLALWIAEAIAEQQHSEGKEHDSSTPLVLASLNEKRDVYVIVGTGGGGVSRTAAGQKPAKTDAAKKKDERKKRKEENRQIREIERKRRAEERAAEKEARKRRKRGASNDSDGDDEDEEDEIEDEGSDLSSSSSESESEEEDADATLVEDSGFSKLARQKNRFGIAFQEVVEETSARVRIDSFEHAVVEVKRDDLATFLESLSVKAVSC